MATAYFQVQLSVQPRTGGEAELVPPEILQGAKWGFLIVKEGGGEAIVQVEAPDAALREIGKAQNCKKLNVKEKEALRKSYPVARTKRSYRKRPPAAQAAAPGPPHETDEKGDPIVDTLQTVRAGFYLIDVPIILEGAPIPPES